MATYTGTISINGTIVGSGPLAGDSATIAQTDNATAILNTNPTTQTYAGTIDQIITTSGTYSLAGGSSAPFTNTQDTGAQSLSGNESQPTTLTFNESATIGLLPFTFSVTETLQLSPDQSSISVSGTEKITVDGQSSTLAFSGTLANTTIPAVAVEASMYGATGTSAEIASLVTNFLPAQVANAIANGYNPQIYACETLGLVFAFGNETGSMAFANNYGPSNAVMPNTTAGDAAFAEAAASLIFGSAETSNTVPAIEQWVANWKAFYTASGIAVGGVSSNPTPEQIDLAARGAAWGDAIGLALFDHLGPFPALVTNFLEDAAQGTAVYGASLLAQPTAAAFQGAATASVTTPADHVQVTGVAAPVDHAIM